MIDKVTALLLQVSLSDELKTLIIKCMILQHRLQFQIQFGFLVTKPGRTALTIKKEIDLIERDLAWHGDIPKDKAFNETVEEIKGCL